MILVQRVVFMLLLYCFTTFAYTADLQLFNAGKKAFSVGLYTIAIENFNSYLENSYSDSKEDDAIYLLGVSNFYLKKYPISKTYFQGLLRDYSDSPYIRNSYYWLGLNNYYLEEYTDSIDNLKYSGEDSSYKEISWLFRSLTHLELDAPDEARSDLLKVINNKDSRDQYREEALYRLGTMLLEEGSNNSAINYLNTLVLDHPNSKYYNESLSLLGESYFLVKEWSSARRVFSLLLESDYGNRGDIYKRLSTVYYNLDDFDTTVEYLLLFKSEVGNNIDVENMLIDIYLKRNEFNKAKKNLEFLIGNYELSEEDWRENAYRLAVIYYRDNEYSKAYKYFSRLKTKEALYYSVISGLNSDYNINSYILELNNRFHGDKYTVDANNRYINYLEGNGNNVELEKLLLILTKNYTNNIKYFLTLGELYLEIGRYDESIKYLSKGYKNGSKYYSNVAYKLGWIYYNKKEYDRAVTYFNSLEKGDSEYNKALYSKGIALYKLGRYASGETAFKELLNTDSTYSKEVSYYLGLIDKEFKKYSSAIKYFNISKESYSLKLDSLNNIAWCFYYLKEFENALNIYLDLIELDELSIHKLNAANCYYYLEKYSDAIGLYKKVFYSDDEYKESMNYKIIENLFLLNKDHEAIDWVETVDIDSSKQLIEVADSFLYKEELARAKTLYDFIIRQYAGLEASEKAEIKIAVLKYKTSNVEESIKMLIEFINRGGSLNNEAVDELVYIIKNLEDPEIIEIAKKELDKISSKDNYIPVYIELIKYKIMDNDIINIIDELLNTSKDRLYSDQLIYLKSHYYLTHNNFETAEVIIKPLVTRENVSVELKIDSIILLCEILSNLERENEAVDLYLKLYVNYPNYEQAEISLYRAYILSKKLNNEDNIIKIKAILTNEYKDSIWTKKVLNEK